MNSVNPLCCQSLAPADELQVAWPPCVTGTDRGPGTCGAVITCPRRGAGGSARGLPSASLVVGQLPRCPVADRGRAAGVCFDRALTGWLLAVRASVRRHRSAQRLRWLLRSIRSTRAVSLALARTIAPSAIVGIAQVDRVKCAPEIGPTGGQSYGTVTPSAGRYQPGRFDIEGPSSIGSTALSRSWTSRSATRHQS
jgi:hypothetical protein